MPLIDRSSHPRIDLSFATDVERAARWLLRELAGDGAGVQVGCVGPSCQGIEDPADGFDVQPATASRILSDLVDRGILVKTSAASRGPSVTYGPGATFSTGRRVRRKPGDDPS